LSSKLTITVNTGLKTSSLEESQEQSLSLIEERMVEMIKEEILDLPLEIQEGILGGLAKGLGKGVGALAKGLGKGVGAVGRGASRLFRGGSKAVSKGAGKSISKGVSKSAGKAASKSAGKAAKQSLGAKIKGQLKDAAMDVLKDPEFQQQMRDVAKEKAQELATRVKEKQVSQAQASGEEVPPKASLMKQIKDSVQDMLKDPEFQEKMKAMGKEKAFQVAAKRKERLASATGATTEATIAESLQTLKRISR